MAQYVAFLRAVNVGGHVVKMEALKDIFLGAGLKNVETFIASGNIIFETKAAPDEALEKKIEGHLEKVLGYEVGTFVRSMAEVAAVAAHRAFTINEMKTAIVTNIGFMRAPLKAEIGAELKGFDSNLDSFHVHGREIYWLCRVRSSDSKFPAKKFERAISGPITWRNLNTVVRLAAKYPVIT